MAIEPLREPVPDWVTAADVDRELISARLADTLEREAPGTFAELMAGRLVWRLDDFDAEGWAHIDIVRRGTGESVGGAECHWSSVVRRPARGDGVGGTSREW